MHEPHLHLIINQILSTLEMFYKRKCKLGAFSATLKRINRDASSVDLSGGGAVDHFKQT